MTSRENTTIAAIESGVVGSNRGQETQARVAALLKCDSIMKNDLRRYTIAQRVSCADRWGVKDRHPWNLLCFGSMATEASSRMQRLISLFVDEIKPIDYV